MKILTTILLTLFLNPIINAQCFPDRHNTNWFDGWISCSTSQNPNSIRGESHWIVYNFGYQYHLGTTHIWNTNAVDYLEDGMKKVVIDISDDGINWTEVGNFDLLKADGSSTYEGFEGPDLSGMKAKYLLITGLENWGGQCFGLSEVKINVDGITDVSNQPESSDCFAVKIFPNPISPNTEAKIITYCSKQEIDFVIQDITGRIIRSGVIQPTSTESHLDLNFDKIISGSYILTLQQNGIIIKEKFVKIE